MSRDVPMGKFSNPEVMELLQRLLRNQKVLRANQLQELPEGIKSTHLRVHLLQLMSLLFMEEQQTTLFAMSIIKWNQE